MDRYEEVANGWINISSIHPSILPTPIQSFGHLNFGLLVGRGGLVQIKPGIENGIYPTNAEESEQWVDAACIVIITKHQHHVLWSDELVLPPVEERTPGPDGTWSVLKDPHIVATHGRRSRAQFLSDAMAQWKKQ